MSLCGVALIWLQVGGAMALLAGVASLFAGSAAVHRYFERCDTCLMLSAPSGMVRVECRIRRLGDDADALYSACLAVQHAAALLSEEAARQSGCAGARTARNRERNLPPLHLVR